MIYKAMRALVMDASLKFEHCYPFFQNGAKSGFEMCFGPSTVGAAAKTRLESKNKEFYITLYSWAVRTARGPRSLQTVETIL